MALKTYRGNCHCAAFVFEATVPEITKAVLCNCSHCYKKGTVWAMIPDTENFTMVKGDLGKAKDYRFARKNFGSKFCPTCGTALLFIGRPQGSEKEHMGVNIRCFQHGLVPDIWNMDTNTYDGASLGAPYETPVYTGPLPTKEVEDGKVYTGSCHCGNVRVCLRSKPLDHSFESPAYECNCSTCIRHGGTTIWPHKDQVVIQGSEHLSTYASGMLKAWEKAFCSQCGVFVVRRPLPIPDEVAVHIPAAAREWTVDAQHLLPLNLKLLDGVDISQLKITHIDGYDVIPPPYVNP
ncbi:unnamed protein product [Clonostachys rosea f. rosea IK726]|uniref:Uncharacterized protein n=1 Tax=Clonostachys rosea f. rosea IK726 TaxID=1349383 RepID=A0ACA9UUU4_BIOOC|nr:unnamed protein product [Clonostachys rosea f. rosea IK726]